MNQYLITRRNFLKQSSVGIATVAVAGGLGMPLFAAGTTGVSIIVASDDTVASSIPSQWAIDQLQQALQAQGVSVQRFTTVSQAPAGDAVIVVGSATHAAPGLPSSAEAMALVAGISSDRSVLFASGNEARGVVYAVLELTDRVLCSTSVGAALTIAAPVIEESHNAIRSICRSFTSELEDKPWYNDRTFWTEYLSMLAAERINRFNLSFGNGYDWGMTSSPIADAYFFFAYPFLVNVNGVSVSGLSAIERDANLAMLKFISEECAKRAIDFHLSIWTSGHIYTSSKYGIQGLSNILGSSGDAAYCRDALSLIIQTCPGITGMMFRVHGESGIPRGNFAFWQTVFSALTPYINAGRPLEIDMHGKECLQGHLDAAIASKAKVVVSPKKLGEHMGLPYHTAALRAKEVSTSSDKTVFDGQASRYGYANFFKENRTFGVLHRIWPGTQRVLLWGDPVFAAALGRFGSFCGSVGMEWNEPLSFKGRGGSGVTGGRCGYSDTALNPTYDFQKFLYYYRLWGRLMYNPDTNPESWRRYLTKQFGAAAQDIENALSQASRILMLVTNCHGASVTNHIYWPEMYTDFPIMDGLSLMGQGTSFWDSAGPLRLAPSFDPQLFMDIDDYAEALLSGTAFNQNKYFPIEFAQWVEDLGTASAASLAAARGAIADANDPVFRRLEVDVAIQSGLGLFFGRKWRSAVLWSIYRKTNDANAKSAALTQYQSAKQAWTDLAARASVYKSNVSYGNEPVKRGHWSDRIAAIASDIDAMTATTYATVTSITTHPGSADSAIATVTGRPTRPVAGDAHTQPGRFSAGTALSISLNADASTTAAKLYYRHVNQADSWQSVVMTKSGSTFLASIPAGYTQTVYPLQYYFALAKGSSAALMPGFASTLDNQPYYVVRSVNPTSSKIVSRRGVESESAISHVAAYERNHAIEVRYSLNHATSVSARLFDGKGRLVASHIEMNVPGGTKILRLLPEHGALASGEYVVHIVAGDVRMSKVVIVSSARR